jgi:hypothetical protein
MDVLKDAESQPDLGLADEVDLAVWSCYAMPTEKSTSACSLGTRFERVYANWGDAPVPRHRPVGLAGLSLRERGCAKSTKENHETPHRQPLE